MTPFFPTLGQTHSNILPDFLSSQQTSLRERKASALLEFDVDSAHRGTLFFAHGEPVGAFLEVDDEPKPVALSELPAVWATGKGSCRIAFLPDVAARLAWLACESPKLKSFNIGGTDGWSGLLNAWRHEGYDGLVQITHESEQGFVYVHNGKPLSHEASFVSDTGFSETPPMAWNGKEMRVTTFARNPAARSYQCLALRQSALRWSESVMKSYRNIAGEKFLQAMSREAMAQIRPWEWNIKIEQGGIRDEHFFDGTPNQALAYRAIFMACGAQMSFAIGNYLTLRILIEMFDELSRDERTMLESHRIIPAAFSN